MIKLLLTVFGGPFGLHKFAEKKWIQGILYLFTAGLFGIGWFIDSILALVALFKPAEKVVVETPPAKPTTSIQNIQSPISTLAQDLAYTIEKHHVAGVSFRQEEIESIGYENVDYVMSKKECIDTGLIDERIYRINFEPIKVLLENEPENIHDPNAIKVIIDNVHVGYIKSGSCSRIRNILNSDKLAKVSAKIMGGDYKIIHSDENENGKEIYSLERGHTDYHITLSFALDE